jgi:hypothetical protein
MAVNSFSMTSLSDLGSAQADVVTSASLPTSMGTSMQSSGQMSGPAVASPVAPPAPAATPAPVAPATTVEDSNEREASAGTGDDHAEHDHGEHDHSDCDDCDDHGHGDGTPGTPPADGSNVFGTLGVDGFVKALAGAEAFYVADLNELNNSDAEGSALLLRDGDILTVLTAATGVEPGQLHVQHIHGFEDGSEAKVPTLAQDDDRDGFIELAEGLDTYGPILLNLSSPDGGGTFPTPNGDAFFFAEQYDLTDPANGELASLLLEAPLENREIVLHGASVLDGHGAGTDGEIDGTAGYKVVLPIAAGEIHEAASAQVAVATFADFLHDANHSAMGAMSDWALV